MHDPGRDAGTDSVASPHAPDEPVAPPPLADAAPGVPGEPAAARADPLAVGVAVLVMAALLGCAAIVLIAAGNA